MSALDEAAARAWLGKLGHPRPEEWLAAKLREGKIRPAGDPPLVRLEDLRRELVRDECMKLYNQAWCALEQIREAGDDPSALMLGIDDLPSAVEQAFGLSPDFAREHLDLLRSHREERHRDLLRELGVGTEREEAERAECLAFWEENAEDISDLRRNLYRMVREELSGRSGGPGGGGPPRR